MTPTPALLTSVACGPDASSGCCSVGPWAARSPTSKGSASERAPAVTKSRTAAFRWAPGAASFTPRSKPLRASSSAIARPIPLLAPVTKAKFRCMVIPCARSRVHRSAPAGRRSDATDGRFRASGPQGYQGTPDRRHG
jgi:hypothetical protein